MRRIWNATILMPWALRHVVGWYTMEANERFDPNMLDEFDPFEIDAQTAHLFKHPHLGIDDVYDVWTSEPLLYEADPPAHWLLAAEVSGIVLIVPIAPANDGDPVKCRPIGCYRASVAQAAQYRKDRNEH